jgi:hypothetical protein
MSKSTTTVDRPRRARPDAKDAAEVVFPTPPFPEVMHTTRPRRSDDDGSADDPDADDDDDDGW